MIQYRTGFCPQCDTPIMVQDVNGMWNSFKNNFMAVALKFEDGHEVMTNICRKCFLEIDYQKMMDALLCEESSAFPKEKKDFIKLKGLPVSHRDRTRGR